MKKEIEWNNEVSSMLWNVLVAVANDYMYCSKGFEEILKILDLEDMEE